MNIYEVDIGRKDTVIIVEASNIGTAINRALKKKPEGKAKRITIRARVIAENTTMKEYQETKPE